MSPQLIDTSIFSSLYLTRTSAAWQALLSNGEYPGSHVRDFIGKSWIRCVENGISHCHAEPPMVRTPGKSLRSLLHQNKDFISATNEALDPLYDVIRRSDTIFIAADANGTLLGCHGEKGITDFAGNANVRIGSNWGEYSCGTNAIGTALAINQAVQVNATEHFCEVSKQWSCSAALVRDHIDRSVIGVVDITGVSNESNDFYHNSLALVISIANHVETILARRSAEQRARLIQWGVDNLRSWHAAGLILLDKRGREVSTHGEANAPSGVSGAPLTRIIAEAKAHLKEVSAGTISSIDDNEWYRALEVDGEILGGAILVPRRFHSLPSSSGSTIPATGSNVQDEFRNIIGRSPKTEEVIHRARRLAASRASILLEGETGVGKEEFAKAIHAGSLCSTGPYLALNCGAIAKDLISSELFGHVEGAFTGARRGGAPGKFEMANGGTLFLDEIGELPLDVQAYLLRVLQDGSVTRLGTSKSTIVKVRVLAATHRDLQDLIRKGLFREDLYYRLSVASLSIPPLRARREDIPPLVSHLLAQFAREYQTEPREVGMDALDVLMQHDWPGNVRELRNVLERVFLLSDDPYITRHHIEAELPGAASKAVHAGVAPDAGAAAGSTLREIEEHFIRLAIRQHHGNLRRAAMQLGISRSTLYEKLARYGIRNEGDKAPELQH